MKRLLFALNIITILLLTGCSCGGGTPETGLPPQHNAAIEFAERFCPVFHLKSDALSVENYEPAPIETFITDAVFVDASTASPVEKAALPWLSDFFSSEYYLDVPGLSPAAAPGILPYYKERYDTLASTGHPTTVYARILETTDTGHTILQYWIFYYFNDWRNVHEGDWELVQLVFPGEPVNKILDAGTLPLFVACSQHQAGQRMMWSDMQAAGLVEGYHPSVYIARGSHANYFTPGQYWSILDFDDTGLSNWQRLIPENIIVIDESGQDRYFDWIDFQGNWGERLGFSISIKDLTFSQNGPTGPAWSSGEHKSARWNTPYAWASSLPEYPAPFWTTFIPGLAEFWPRLAVFSVFSPADIHVYDGEGRHAGLDDKGQFITQIPGAMYLTPEGTSYKTIVIPDADISNNYRLVINGTGEGTMDIVTQVPDSSNRRQYIRYEGIAVSPQMKAMLTIQPVAEAKDAAPGVSLYDTTTILSVDREGDGTFESMVEPGTSAFTKAPPAEPTITATVSLTIKAEGGGTTKPEPGIYRYETGKTLSITAVPDKGWEFAGWEGDIRSNSTTIEVLMDDDKTVIARFTPLQIKLVPDQQNYSETPFETINITRYGLSQSFVPALPALNSVEVYLRSDNSSTIKVTAVRFEITGSDGKILASQEVLVPGTFEGWVKFDIEEELKVTIDETFYLVLRSTDNASIGWAYGADTYTRGSAFAGDELLQGDFFFRTWSS